jgi:glycosyltransferase involved in cell wall biosynthesis
MSTVIRNQNPDVLLLYGGPIWITLPLFASAKFKSLCTVAEICEWFPSDIFTYGWFDKEFISELIYRNFVPMFSDAALCISTYIQKKVSKYNRNTVLIPALGSEGYVSVPSINGESGVFRVVYSGKFKKEDAAYLLIEAVGLCVKRGLNMKLEMIGGFDYGDEAYYKSLVKSDPLLTDVVSFTPDVQGDEYWRRIGSASCLVIVRPHSKTNTANFPTRLPEFLLTGKPVITSSVGDIERYLKSGVHAHIIDRINPETLAEALIKIYFDQEYAAKLGRQGRNIARMKFNHVVYGEELAEVMRGIIRGRQRTLD